ncbi:MAG: hypothetical protein HC798_04470 [Polaribacter sp.]|nr:hypothetical protein [Polaribacter sp.]
MISAFGWAQTQKELETQRKQIQLEIKRVNKLLVSEKSKEKNALDGLRDLNIKIGVRNKLINNINLEALLLKRQV